MSNSEIRTPYLAAMKIAVDFLEKTEEGYARNAIAGSLRRKKSDVGDIEIVCIPAYRSEYDLFGTLIQSVRLLDLWLEEVYDTGDYQLATITDKNGRQYQLNGSSLKKIQHVASGLCIDLYITTQPQWGAIYTLRTGSAEFSHWLVTPRKYGGAMPSNLKLFEGLLRNEEQIIPTPEEVDFFAALKVPWLHPELRTRAGVQVTA